MVHCGVFKRKIIAGIKVGTWLPWDADKSIMTMMSFFPEYFLVALPSGLMRKRWRLRKGSNHEFLPNFFSKQTTKTASGSLTADWRFLHVQETDGWTGPCWPGMATATKRTGYCETETWATRAADMVWPPRYIMSLLICTLWQSYATEGCCGFCRWI